MVFIYRQGGQMIATINVKKSEKSEADVDCGASPGHHVIDRFRYRVRNIKMTIAKKNKEERRKKREQRNSLMSLFNENHLIVIRIELRTSTSLLSSDILSLDSIRHIIQSLILVSLQQSIYRVTHK